jgi:hypothetical protein
MPKAAVYENDLLARWEDNVGGAGQIATIQPKPVPEGMKQPAYYELGRGILSANPRHQCTSTFRCSVVYHGSDANLAEAEDPRSTLCLEQMLTKKESEKSGKPPVIEYLYDKYANGEIPDGLITSDRLVEAIRATNASLGTANPANFLKDIIRSEHANSIWPKSLTGKGISARQRYGAKRVFQFIEFIEGQKEPFPDNYPIDENTNSHNIQSASLPFAARQLGRKEETWLTQVVVNLRLVESQLSIFSPLRSRVRDVTHLQTGMKTAPEIDAVFLATYGETAELKSQTNLNVLVTCEAKQINQRILEDQIREQVAKALEVTADIQNPRINAVKPMAIKVVDHRFADKNEKAIYVVEFSHINREEFNIEWSQSSPSDERLYSMPLNDVSKTVYRIMPPVAGLNAN